MTAARPLNFCRCRRGSAAVEFALVLPILLLLLFGAIEFGRALWLANALHYAVEEAARCGSVNSVNCGTTTQIKNYALSRSGMTFPASAFTVTWSKAGGCGSKVVASYRIALHIPFIAYAPTLRAQSCFPL